MQSHVSAEPFHRLRIPTELSPHTYAHALPRLSHSEQRHQGFSVVGLDLLRLQLRIRIVPDSFQWLTRTRAHFTSQTRVAKRNAEKAVLLDTNHHSQLA